ncbi:hypothetical protein [Desulfosporosinus nitroreducens]|uniref:hypothetical protein n=1 Tax=Desulfosporosinus nitroreducens TaxID=2018668 RepID=UPI00207C2E9D|nr:hypothetical protein [Desulfosporosinus nitroreducens]MCO1603796.1 hypothetical protein [Desulfosporosinus nitroreducens]
MRKLGTDVRRTLCSGSKVLIDGQACPTNRQRCRFVGHAWYELVTLLSPDTYSVNKI